MKEYLGSRAGATLAQMRNDIMEGIEGKNVVSDLMRGVRNAAVAGWHGLQGIIPSIANAASDQQFTVIQRDGPLHGTANSIAKVFQTKGLLGKASAVFAEATDGPVDDTVHALTGGAEWIVKPVASTRSRSQHLLSTAA